MNTFKEIVTCVACGIEAFGVLIVVIGYVAGTTRLLSRLQDTGMSELYHEYRQFIGPRFSA